MFFAHPQLLWLLLLPAALLIWELARRARTPANAHPRILHAEASGQHLRLDVATTTSPRRRPRKVKAALYTGLALGILALARPQYGEREEPVFEQSREVLIALDLSRSMLAEDIKPNRLTRAKLLISGLFERLAGERVGLIVFSGTAFLQSPLSSDYEILRDFLPALGPDTLPEGGTHYRALIDTALDAFSDTPATDRFLIILSDGEATDDTWQRALDSLKKRGIRTLALGIGSPTGAMIPDGTGGLVKDPRGAVVLSKLEPATLRALATATGGLYRDASTWLDLADLITETVEQGTQGQFTDTRSQRHIDRYQWALAPALALLLLSFWREFPIRPRPRALALHPAKKTTTAALLFAALLASDPVAAQLPLTAQPKAAPTPTDAPTLGDVTATPARTLEEPKAPTSNLGKIVARLSEKPTPPTGRDWAELARETVTWGQQLQTAQHPVPPGPVHDALRATEIGETLDPKTADWPTLRSELDALLEEPPPEQQQPQPDKNEPPPSQEQSQPPEQNQTQDGDAAPNNSQEENQQQQQPNGSESQNDSSDNNSDGDDKPQQDSQAQEDSERGNEEKQSGNKPNVAASDRNAQKEESPTTTQQVGGAQPQHSSAPEANDPALAASLQKLEKIRSDDSPAQLFQLMDDTPRPEAAAPAKNW